MVRWWLSALVLGSGCSFGLDFDEIDGLPCPCDVGFVCLEGTGTCAAEGSVDAFKSCRTDTPLFGNELCPPNHLCETAGGSGGPRCLPVCSPVNYARPDDGRRIAEQCPFGTTCITTQSGAGVCAEGECQDNPNRGCGPSEVCGVFNGAGICFAECDLAEASIECGPTQMCHPIGPLALAACVDAGTVQSGEICTRPEDGMCQKEDASFSPRPLVCARPAASTSSALRCSPACNQLNPRACEGTETCQLVRANVSANYSLGVCR